MDEPNEIQGRAKPRLFPKTTLLIMGGAVGLAAICFVVVALLPASEEPYFESPLRSVLTGLGLLGVACPFCIIGSALRRRSAGSPYFEEAFIASVISLFGYVCVLFGLLCTGLGVYALVMRLWGSE
jgi:hypothetical protein